MKLKPFEKVWSIPRNQSKKALIRSLLLSFITELSKKRKYLKFRTNNFIFLETYYYFLYKVFKKSNGNFILN